MKKFQMRQESIFLSRTMRLQEARIAELEIKMAMQATVVNHYYFNNGSQFINTLSTQDLNNTML